MTRFCIDTVKSLSHKPSQFVDKLDLVDRQFLKQRKVLTVKEWQLLSFDSSQTIRTKITAFDTENNTQMHPN